jgi:xanthine dehydrogenase accessory factor
VILKALREAGVPQAALDRVVTPIGLDIGADTPAEIGVSVVAELVKVRRG